MTQSIATIAIIIGFVISIAVALILALMSKSEKPDGSAGSRWSSGARAPRRPRPRSTP